MVSRTEQRNDLRMAQVLEDIAFASQRGVVLGRQAHFEDELALIALEGDAVDENAARRGAMAKDRNDAVEITARSMEGVVLLAAERIGRWGCEGGARGLGWTRFAV